MSNRLPYVFDLLYDIKTLDELNNHLSGRQRTATSATDAGLYELAKNNGVTCEGVAGCTHLPTRLGEQYGMCEDHLLRPEGSMCPFCRAARLESMLVRLARPESGLMPDLVTSIKTLLEATGYGHY